MLMHVPDVEDAYIDHLDDLFVAIFYHFPQLFEGQRRVQYEAISRLFLALYAKGSALSSLASRISTPPPSRGPALLIRSSSLQGAAVHLCPAPHRV